MQITVTSNGQLTAGNFSCRCALGRSGVGFKAGEGDGVTPVGTFAMRGLWYRPDREPKPQTALPVRAIQPEDGWCDDPAHPFYNRPVKLPFAASHEQMWREDHCYDLVLELGYNDRPVVPGKGSAIFLHLAREGYAPTEGCIALSRDDFHTLLSRLDSSSIVTVRATSLPG